MRIRRQRAGYAVAPKEVIDEMVAYRTVTNYQTNTLSQLTLKNYIQAGEFEKHIHRMRRIYAKKRNGLKQAIIDYNFPGKLRGIESGLNGLIELNSGIDAIKLSKQALDSDIYVTSLSRYTHIKKHSSSALVLGYSALSIAEIKSGIELLSSIATTLLSRC